MLSKKMRGRFKLDPHRLVGTRWSFEVPGGGTNGPNERVAQVVQVVKKKIVLMDIFDRNCPTWPVKLAVLLGKKQSTQGLGYFHPSGYRYLAHKDELSWIVRQARIAWKGGIRPAYYQSDLGNIMDVGTGWIRIANNGQDFTESYSSFVRRWRQASPEEASLYDEFIRATSAPPQQWN